MLTFSTLGTAEIATLIVGLIVSLLVGFATHRWLVFNPHYVTWIAHRVHGIEPMKRRNSYRSTRTNSFISLETVESAERRTHLFAHWLVLPIVSAIPTVVLAVGVL